MIDLTTVQLTRGIHDYRDDGVCLLEAVAWFAGEKHSDAPDCASPALVIFGAVLNDALPDDERQQLVALIPDIAGTADDGLDETRSLLALDWLVRVYAPTWLDLAGLRVHAALLGDLSPLCDAAAVGAAWPVVSTAQAAAFAARATAARGSADWIAGEAAAGAIAWIAAATAWAAVGAAELGIEAGSLAAAAGGAAAGAAAIGWASDAACWIASEADKGSAICRGVGDAWRAVQPVVDDLQRSALGLYGDMVRAGTAAPVAGIDPGAAVADDSTESYSDSVPLLLGTWEVGLI